MASMSKNHFEAPTNQSLPNTLRGVGKAAYTIFMVPEHDSSTYETVAKILRNDAQPTQLRVGEEVAVIRQRTRQRVREGLQPRLGAKELFGLMGVLMQFTSYLPRLRPYCQTPFSDVEALYKELVAHGRIKPLGFAAQLDLALKQTKGDLPEALWRLFITSRLYARWFDTSVITDIPKFTKDEVIERMLAWSRSVAACKPYGTCSDQDASGDTYYCWTHALAKVAFKALAAKQTPLTRLEAAALRNGTRLNHGLAHKFKPQRLKSDHTIAAEYGNAIGEACVAILDKNN